MTDIKSLIKRLRKLETGRFGSEHFKYLGQAADALEALTDRLEAMEKENLRLHEEGSKGYYTPTKEAELRHLRAELAEERRKREEWVCRGCKKAFRAETVPDRPSCITCPDCGGDRMPKTMAEREDWKAKYEAAREVAYGFAAVTYKSPHSTVDELIAAKLAEGKK